MAIDGTTVAESSNPYFLLETMLPARYYLPKTSIVDWSILSESNTVTACPYKGEAKCVI